MHRKLNIAVWVLIILVFSTGIVSAGVLRKGARGPEVTSLQENLIQLGYDTSATGYFGPQTETALRNFQNDEGLSTDGVYGRQTAAVLEEKLAGRGDKSYIVQPGDTLTVIAINHDVSVSELRSSNNINGSTIHPGDELRIPGENGKLSGQGGVDSESVEEIHHQVRIGEALSTIARAHGIDVDTLRQANNISGDMIRAGDELVVPVSRSSEGNSRNSNNFSWPLDGRITSNYGNRRHPVTGRTNFHTGVDIAAAYG
ncbi:MAG: LysM peptidoglycan-binding domain-containing protein, partial [Bacillota bacterium]